MSIVIQKPAYFTKVGDAFFKGENDTDVTSIPSIKSVGATDQKAETTIYASGKVYDYSSKKTSVQLALQVVALPEKMIRDYLGQETSTNGGFAFETSDDTLKDFAFGYTENYSDGKQRFKWYPRCRLIEVNHTKEDPGNNATDPSFPYVILALPMDSGLICVKYDQSEVAESKKPLTEAEFFADVINKSDHATVDTEKVAGV